MDGRCLRSGMGAGVEGATYVTIGSRGPLARGDVGRGERSLLLCGRDSILHEGWAVGASNGAASEPVFA